MIELAETADVELPAELNPNDPIQLPEGLNLFDVEKYAKENNGKWEKYANDLRSNWEDNYRLFKEFEKRARKKVTHKVPEIWVTLQTEIPLLVNSAFSKSELVRNLPLFEDTANTTLKIKNYINREIIVGAKGRKKITDAIQNFLVFGTTVAKCYWDTSTVPQYNSELGQWERIETGKPNFENIDLFDFAIDPDYSGHDVNEAKWVRQRLYFTKSEMKQMEANGLISNVDDLDLVPSSAKEESGKKIRDNIEGRDGLDKNKVYVDEFWCDYDYETPEGETMTGKYWFWLLNNKKVIKFRPNDFERKPFIVSRCYRLSNEFFGMGEVDIMKAYVEQMSDIHAKCGVLGKRVGGKVTMYTPASGFNSQDAKMIENGMIMVDDLNQIRSENTTAGNDLQTLLNYKNSIKGDIEGATGVNEIIKGEPLGDTATEASILNQNSSARLILKFQNLQDEFLVPLAENFYLLAKQFINDFQFFYRGNTVSLTPADFDGEYEWQAVGSVSQANKSLRIRQLTEFAGQVSSAAQAAPMVKAAGFDLMGFIHNEILPLFDIQDADKYFVEPAQSAPGMPIADNANPNMPEMPLTEPDMAAVEGRASSVVPS